MIRVVLAFLAGLVVGELIEAAQSRRSAGYRPEVTGRAVVPPRGRSGVRRLNDR